MDKPISLLSRQPEPLGTDRVPVVRMSEPEAGNRNQYSTWDDVAGWLGRSLSLTGTQANEFFIGEEYSQSQDVEYRVLVYRTLEGSPGVARGIRWQSTPTGLQTELVRCRSYQSPPTNPLNTWETDLGGGEPAEELSQVATRTVGGISAGQSYTYLDDPNGRTLKAALTPENPPTVGTFTASNTPRQPGSAEAVVLSYSVSPGTNNLQSLTVAGQSISVGDGTTTVSGTVSVTIDTSVSTSVNYSLVATDTDGLTTTRTATVRVQSKRFWGPFDLNPATATDGALSTALKALAGQEYGETRQQTRTITLDDEYPVFAYKATAGAPTVKVGGLLNSAYQTRAFTFINSEGEPESFLLVYGTLNSGTLSIELL